MKKKYLAVILAACMAFSVTACGKSDDSQSEENGSSTNTEASAKPSGDDEKTETKKQDPTVALNYNLGDYVTLGTYKAIEYKEYVTDVTDEEITKELEADIAQNKFFEEVDRKVKDNDYVIITFTGKIDGKADDNLAGTSQTLNIGSKSYIDGFESGLIGHKKGDEVVLNLTFPKDYNSDDYAGKDVEFTVKIESVNEIPKITDAFIKKNFGTESELKDTYGWDTLDTARNSIKSDISSTKKSDAEKYKLQDIMDALVNGCKFKELPKDYINEYYESNVAYYQDYADYYTQMYQTELSLEDFASTFMGMTLDELKDLCTKYANESVKQDVALWAIAEKEKIELSDDDYNKKVNELFESYKDSAGYTDASQFIEANGGEKTVRLRLRILAARDWVLENAKQNGSYTERPADAEE